MFHEAYRIVAVPILMASEPGDRSVLPPQSCMASSVPVLPASGQKVSAAPRRKAPSAGSGALPPDTAVVGEEQQQKARAPMDVADPGMGMLSRAEPRSGRGSPRCRRLRPQSPLP